MHSGSTNASIRKEESENAELLQVCKETLEAYQLTLRQGNDECTVIVTDLSDKRGPAEVVQQLYKVALACKMNALSMPHSDRRPDKKNAAIC